VSTIQRIARNTTALLVAQVASYLLSFFYMMYAARYLAPANFGILSFAIAFTGIFAIFADFGLQPLMVREIARDRTMAPKYLANVSLMKVILVAVAYGLVALTINLMGYPEETVNVVYLLGLSFVFQAFTQVFYSIFQAFEKMEFQAIGQMLNAALLLGGVMFAIRHDFTVVGFASLYTVASAVALGYSFAVMKLKLSSPASAPAVKLMELDRSFWKLMIKEALPFGLIALFGAVYYGADTIILSSAKGDAVVGWYGAAYRMVLILLFVPTALGFAIFPVMSRFYTTSPDSLRHGVEKLLKYMTMLGIPLGVGTTLLAQRIIWVVFGPEYTPAAIALQILVWSVVLVYIGGPMSTLLQTTNRQGVVARIVGTSVFVNVVANLILIPRYSYVAAGTVAVVTTLISVTMQYVACSKTGWRVVDRKLLISLGKTVVGSVAMGLFIYYLGNLTLLLLIPLAILLYFGMLFALRFFNKEDMLIIRQIAGRQ
jgi:O-antigen/teichoic acid export membrane protein